MPESATIEQRLENCEAAAAELKLQGGAKKVDWLSIVSRSFRDDPEFAEIVRLGKETC